MKKLHIFTTFLVKNPEPGQDMYKIFKLNRFRRYIFFRKDVDYKVRFLHFHKVNNQEDMGCFAFYNPLISKCWYYFICSFVKSVRVIVRMYRLRIQNPVRLVNDHPQHTIFPQFNYSFLKYLFLMYPI